LKFKQNAHSYIREASAVLTRAELQRWCSEGFIREWYLTTTAISVSSTTRMSAVTPPRHPAPWKISAKTWQYYDYVA